MKIVQVPVTDVVWLRAALDDALAGKICLLPLAADAKPFSHAELESFAADPVCVNAAVLLATSGSTGEPKVVALSANALLANARASHEALGAAGQWLVVLPLHLISGLGQLVRCIVADTKPVIAVGASVVEWLVLARQMTAVHRYISLVPKQLNDLLVVCENDAQALQTAREFTAILVGGGALSLQARQRAYELGLNIVRTYGATETCGGCVYDGVEIGDTRVRVRGGQVELSGSNLALGYVGAPEMTAQAFVTEKSEHSVSCETLMQTEIDNPQFDNGERKSASSRSRVSERWYLTGDAGELLGGMLSITGRLDRVYISGGTNVSLDRVSDLLTSKNIPGISECIAVAVNSDVWGQSLALMCVPAAAGKTTPIVQQEIESQIKHYLLNEIGPAASPKIIEFVDELPRLVSGKPDLLQITALLQQQADSNT